MKFLYIHAFFRLPDNIGNEDKDLIEAINLLAKYETKQLNAGDFKKKVPKINPEPKKEFSQQEIWDAFCVATEKEEINFAGFLQIGNT